MTLSRSPTKTATRASTKKSGLINKVVCNPIMAFGDHRFYAGQVLLAILAVSLAPPVVADSTEARCDIYPAGDDHTDVVIPCIFSQRQGYITIARGDGVTHELSPDGDTVGNFRDQYGRRVYRQGGLGDQGLVFRFPDESVYVYWSTSALHPDETDNPAAPFTTADYDATTLLRCRATADSEVGQCPAGILRMDDGQASIVVLSPAGEQFTINFMTDYINAANREVQARMEGDTWIVIINDREIYEVPLAAIEGG